MCIHVINYMKPWKHWTSAHMSVICTGLIIDAFGELRDQQEQVKEDMEVLILLLYLYIYIKEVS